MTRYDLYRAWSLFDYPSHFDLPEFCYSFFFVTLHFVSEVILHHRLARCPTNCYVGVSFHTKKQDVRRSSKLVESVGKCKKTCDRCFFQTPYLDFVYTVVFLQILLRGQVTTVERLLR
jgi:hypothetical protein